MPEQSSSENTNLQPVTPYLCIRGAGAAIEFYQRAFGARELMRLDAPGGLIGHAEIMIEYARIMLSDEFPEMDVVSPATLGGSPVTIHLYVNDADTLAARAVSAGMTVLRPVETQFYGDRGGKFRDPFGHIWWIATHVEDVSMDEIRRRAESLYGA
ncbi:MAG: VOC family protein [Gemmatimonadota bacterium]